MNDFGMGIFMFAVMIMVGILCILVFLYRILLAVDPMYKLKQALAEEGSGFKNYPPSLEEEDLTDDTYPPEMLEDMRMEMNSLRQIPTEEGLVWIWGIHDNRIYERLIKKHFKKR